MSTPIRIALASLASLAVLAATSATTVAARPTPARRDAMGAHAFLPRELALQSRTVPFPTFKGFFNSGSALVGSAPVGNGPDFSALDPATVSALQARAMARGVLDSHDRLTAQSATIGLLPSAPVGSLPQGAAFDPATDTVYVANQNDNTVSVVDARHCNTRDTSGCARTSPTVAVGAGPFSIAIDDATHTVYVANQNDNTISVLDDRTCNGHDSQGCRATPPVVAAGPTPFGIAVDRATDTVYVADSGGANDSVSVINGATCNASFTTGCGQSPVTANVGQFPFGVLVDPQNSTVYVTNAGDNTVSMIDERTCNATDISGCARTFPTVSVGSFPIPLALDARTGTLYVGSQNFGPNATGAGSGPTVVVLNAHTCNARHTTGCAGPHPTLTVEGGTDGMSIDDRTDTLFVSNNGPGSSPAQERSVSVIDASTCNAQTTAGCGQHAPTALTGANPGGNALDPATGTEYVTTFDNTLQVINGATCNARDLTGCGQPAPGADAGTDPFSIAVNPASNSVYVGGAGGFEGFPWSISILAAATCNTIDREGCSASPPSVVWPAWPFALTPDPTTDTIYSSDLVNANGDLGNTVSAINGTTCNATVTSGCAATPASLTIPGAADGSAENLATHTLYVADNSAPAVSVYDASTCNTADTAGCGQAPSQIPLGGAGPVALAVDQATNTIYALNPGSPGTVSVIDGATCNASDRSGCGNVPPTVTVGDARGFDFLAVDQATNSVYVVNGADDTVSVINGATCNSSVTTSCDQPPTIVHVGHQGFVNGVGIDQATNLVYVTNHLDDTVSVIDGNSCNGTVTTTCNRIQPTIPAGGNPAELAVNPKDGTVYVADSGGATATFFRFVRPARPTGIIARRSGNTVRLSWQPPYDGGLPIIYQIVPSPACPSCTGLRTPATSGQPDTTVTGLAAGTAYSFEIRAVDAAGTGPLSAASSPVGP